VNKTEIHKILDECIEEGEGKKLYGQTNFTIHWQAGKVKQVTDIATKRTWKGIDDKA